MQNNKGLDAISMLTDVLFRETDGPAPSFPANRRRALARLGYKTADAAAPDVTEDPLWQPAP